MKRKRSRFLMRAFIWLCLCGVFTPCDVFADYPASYAPQFFAMLQDVPLMPGLVEVDEGAFSFDKPEGGIRQASADMAEHSSEQVKQFYMSSLPQFGWRVINQTHYVRDGEVLELSFQGHLVVVMIRPVE